MRYGSAMKRNNPRVAIYLRCSTQEQSTDLQRMEIERLADQRGWTELTFFEDKASGTTTKRPHFAAMLTSARTGQFDVIIVWRLDRFARSLKDLVTTLHELTELNVAFVSVRDQIDLTTSTGRLMLHLLGAFSQFEADLIRERVKAGLMAARAKGRRLGRPRSISAGDVHRLRRDGLSIREIAGRLKVSKSAVHKTLLNPAP
jgi:DNA invertase Pin-like site-specific DNA recombinase